MKKYFLSVAFVAVFFFITGTAYAQKTNEIDWLGQIDRKTAVTYGDAVTLFIFQLGKNPSTFEKDSADLDSAGIGLQGYNEGDVLTKGMLSKMTARYLDLDGSFMYLIFGTERYAFKVCVANGFFYEDGSSSDILSGPAMIEVFSKISEIKGEQK